MMVMFMTERITMRGTVKGGPTRYSTHSIFNSAKNSLSIVFFMFQNCLLKCSFFRIEGRCRSAEKRFGADRLMDRKRGESMFWENEEFPREGRPSFRD